MSLTYEPNEPGVQLWADEQDPQRWHLDVRELLTDGGEPYPIIMECVAQLAAGQHLMLHTLMQPRPLIGQLGRMGFAPAIHHAGPDHWVLDIAAP